jgi:hypothetical protein
MRLKGWKGVTVTVADQVKGTIPSNDRKRDVPFAGQTGVIVPLNTCLPSCARPQCHAEGRPRASLFSLTTS